MSEDNIERDGIKWGAEIAVDGKRPEWLRNDMWDKVAAQTKWGDWQYPCSDTMPNMREWEWSHLTAIRLPADHPYYAQEKVKEIDPALVERMVAHLRDFASWDATTDSWYALFKRWQGEARDILKALEPVDPDVAIAEDIAASFHEGEYEAIALAALKRGRQLEREETNA